MKIRWGKNVSRLKSSRLSAGPVRIPLAASFHLPSAILLLALLVASVVLLSTEGVRAQTPSPETSFQEFVFEFPPAPPPTPEQVIVGPGGERGIAMPGGIKNPIVFPEPTVKRVELDIQSNWLYVIEFQPPLQYGIPNLCVAYLIPRDSGGVLEGCQDGLSQQITDGPVSTLAQNPGNSYFEISHSPDDTLRHVLTITGTANDHGSGPPDATLVEIGAAVAGSLRQGVEDIDWFAFQGRAGEWYALHLSLDSQGDLFNYLGVSPPSGGQSIGFPVLNPLTFQAKTTGLYTVELHDLNYGRGLKPAHSRPYTFTVTQCANHPLSPLGCGSKPNIGTGVDVGTGDIIVSDPDPEGPGHGPLITGTADDPTPTAPHRPTPPPSACSIGKGQVDPSLFAALLGIVGLVAARRWLSNRW